ncbi:MAG: fused MFS/spermidine synthase [Planctomycetota bacterium]|nr:fused MFS/spermidine synthase [Planctomycetota bacterium]MCX8038966.1 fused MFS/spermidine synthase [Planctomycetota bacterium]MDW8372783.1 fused MFS/spermidine synthase [Planctomycetota bacterium]
MRLAVLYATSIVCGFCLMALEILGARFLYPSFGSSIDVWAAIITVFILSLSIGYVIGGRLADRSTDNQPLGWVILAAGALYLTLPIYALSVAESFGDLLGQYRFGVLVAGLVLFLVPSLLLGMVSPMLVKLAFVSAERVGRTTGTLYAVGSIGNVLGILVTDYVLLEFVPLNANLLWMGAVLAVVGCLHVAWRLRVERAAAPAPAGAP